MKKRFGIYTIYWAILLVLFNVIASVSPGWITHEKYTVSFWTGYILICVAFLGQLVCAYVALKESSTQKLFYNISLLKTSYSGLIATFVFGSLCMLISSLPYWIGVLLCAIILVANVLSVVKAVAVVGEVARIDEKVKAQTFFIKSLTVDADTLMARAKSDAVKAECKKVYEAIRYSDPMSDAVLTGIESQITLKFAQFSEIVAGDDVQNVMELAKELLVLLNDRNSKSRLLK